MTKLEKAVEIVRGWSDEELKEYAVGLQTVGWHEERNNTGSLRLQVEGA